MDNGKQYDDQQRQITITVQYCIELQYKNKTLKRGPNTIRSLYTNTCEIKKNKV